jgi:pre-mRNA-splicing helicase BRR2
MVDVIASEGWLKPALSCMELSQMVAQAIWIDTDSVLMQVPHISKETVARLSNLGKNENDDPSWSPVESVFDLISMEDSVRRRVLGLSNVQLSDVAKFCNRYPNIDMSYAIQGGGETESSPVVKGEPVTLGISLEREDATGGMDEGARLGTVYSSHFPKQRTEGWWVVIGDVAKNVLLGIKRVSFSKQSSIQVTFDAPSAPGQHELSIYLMSDSYIGCDQEYQCVLYVTE